MTMVVVENHTHTHSDCSGMAKTKVKTKLKAMTKENGWFVLFCEQPKEDIESENTLEQ